MRKCMNWDAISFDWTHARAFLATAQEGSLSGAARVLRTTQPTVGRQVKALEADLGVTLFERAGRGLVLTHSGKAVLEEVRAMAEAATRVSLVSAGRNEQIAGRVTISVSDIMAIYVMPEIVAQLTERVPEIEVELIVTNELSDLTRREADIALRFIRPQEPELITRLIRRSDAQFFASPAFIRRYGRPRNAEEARDMPFIGMGPPDAMVREMALRGVELREENFGLFSSSGPAAWEMARQGLGIGVMLADVAVRTPEMEVVLHEQPAIPVEFWLTAHSEVRESRRIRVVFDFLAEALAR